MMWLDKSELYAVEASKRNVDVVQVYKNTPKLMRALRRIFIELNIPIISPWFSSWKKKLTNYKTIIVHASILTVPVVKYINKNYPNIRVIVWYWNPVSKTVSLDKYPNNCEVWSFDEEDCNKYLLNYNTQYYFKNITLPKNNIEYDVIFVGGDKGRIERLIEIEELFNKLNLKSMFHITKTPDSPKKYNNKYSDRISYNQILNYISKSKAILDIVSEGQTGLTLRPLEALFFNKKLITNDLTIVDRDFYKKENIFVLGKDNINNLKSFLETPNQPVEKELVNKYDFDEWLKRFFV